MSLEQKVEPTAAERKKTSRDKLRKILEDRFKKRMTLLAKLYAVNKTSPDDDLKKIAEALYRFLKENPLQRKARSYKAFTARFTLPPGMDKSRAAILLSEAVGGRAIYLSNTRISREIMDDDLARLAPPPDFLTISSANELLEGATERDWNAVQLVIVNRSSQDGDKETNAFLLEISREHLIPIVLLGTEEQNMSLAPWSSGTYYRYFKRELLEEEPSPAPKASASPTGAFTSRSDILAGFIDEVRDQALPFGFIRGLLHKPNELTCKATALLNSSDNEPRERTFDLPLPGSSLPLHEEAMLVEDYFLGLHSSDPDLTAKSKQAEEVLLKAHMNLIRAVAENFARDVAADPHDLFQRGAQTFLECLPKYVPGFSRLCHFMLFSIFRDITRATLSVQIDLFPAHVIERRARANAAPNPEENLVLLQLRKQIRNRLATLRPDEKDILEKRFGIGATDEEGLTNAKIGVAYALTRERIRQIADNGMKKLRHPGRAKALRPFVE